MPDFVPSIQDLPLDDAQAVSDLFDQAAAANLDCPLRRGATIHLPPSGSLFMTGDLHDHGLNFKRILHLTDLANHSDRHLVLHEVIHGPHRVNGRDLSVRTLARVAGLVRQFPNRVHVLLANHELAQLNREEVLKGGTPLVEAFDMGVEFIYHDAAPRVNESLCRFIRSLPLAVRCSNGILCSHSLPSPRLLDKFDTTILDRVLTDADLAVGGHAYHMVWGRSHTPQAADTLAKAWDVKLFIMGHQPAEVGFYVEGDNMTVLASDHDHGVILPLDLTQAYDQAELVNQIVPLASVVL